MKTPPVTQFILLAEGRMKMYYHIAILSFVKIKLHIKKTKFPFLFAWLFWHITNYEKNKKKLLPLKLFTFETLLIAFYHINRFISSNY